MLQQNEGAPKAPQDVQQLQAEQKHLQAEQQQQQHQQQQEQQKHRQSVNQPHEPCTGKDQPNSVSINPVQSLVNGAANSVDESLQASASINAFKQPPAAVNLPCSQSAVRRHSHPTHIQQKSLKSALLKCLPVCSPGSLRLRRSENSLQHQCSRTSRQQRCSWPSRQDLHR